jgi:hypothetical protein
MEVGSYEMKHDASQLGWRMYSWNARHKQASRTLVSESFVTVFFKVESRSYCFVFWTHYNISQVESNLIVQ